MSAPIGGATATANDPDDGDDGYGAGDEIVVNFDAATGPISGAVDTLFSFSQDIGDSYSGSWSTGGKVYTISITTPASIAPRRISTILTGLGDLDGLSMPLLGDWGGRQVSWTSLVSASEGANGALAKPSGSSNWNAGAISNETVLEEIGDFGFFETRVPENDKKMAFGLSKGNSGTLFSDIDFALFTGSDGTLRVYEGGAEKHNHGSFESGDLLRMEVHPMDNKVHYFRNDVEFYVSGTTLTSANFPLIVDVAMESVGSEITVPRINLLPVNHPPVAVNDAYTTQEDTPLIITAANGLINGAGLDSDEDGDTLIVTLLSDVNQGTLALATDGSFVYTPAPNQPQSWSGNSGPPP
jgi:hypothetical protein